MAITDFKQEGDKVIFTGNYLEVYIPRYYFDSGISEKLGNVIKTFGIFNFKVFKSSDKKDNPKLETFKFPSVFETTPSIIENADMKEINPADSAFTVLKYFKGDTFINNVNIAKSADNTMLFINLLHGGKLPRTIPYNEIAKLEMDNLSFNDVNLNVSATILELIVSELYRSKGNLSRSFRFDAAAGKDLLAYEPINLKQIANSNSTFTAVTFEDLDYALLTSANKLRTNAKEAISPIEKTIKY